MSETALPDHSSQTVLDICFQSSEIQILQENYSCLLPQSEDKSMGVLLWHLNDYILDADDTFCDMLGYTRQAFQEGRIKGVHITPSEFAELDKKAIGHLQQNGVAPPYEKQLITKDGRRIDVLCSLAMPASSQTVAIGYILDISEWKQTANRHRLIESASQDGFWDMDRHTGQTYLNERFLEMLGITENHDKANHDFWERIHPEDRERVMALYQTHIGQADPSRFETEFRIRHESGQYRTLYTRGAAFEDSHGTSARVVGAVTDITGKVMVAEEQNRSLEREKLLRHLITLMNQTYDVDTILNTLADEIGRHFRVDRCSVIRYANDMTGDIDWNLCGQYRSSSDIVTIPVGDFPFKTSQFTGRNPDAKHPTLFANYAYPQDYQNQTLPQLATEEDTKRHCAIHRHYTDRYQIKSGLALEILFRNTPYGAIVMHQCQHHRIWQEEEIALLEDIATHLGTALHQSELYHQEVSARESAETANKRKSQFLATMSHELRTPLNAIIAYGQMLENGMVGNLGAKAQRYIRNIVVSGKDLLDLVNELLDLSRIESGKVILNKQFIPVENFISLNQATFEEMATQREVTLNFNRQEMLEMLYADPARLKQIFLNLITNAIKFNTPGGKVDVRLILSPEGKWFECEVEDTGIGIPKEKLSEIFSEFYQVDNSFSRGQEGAGLGLAVTRRLVELHGGSISVRSQLGSGTIITFRIPNLP